MIHFTNEARTHTDLNVRDELEAARRGVMDAGEQASAKCRLSADAVHEASDARRAYEGAVSRLRRAQSEMDKHNAHVDSDHTAALAREYPR